MKKLLSMLLCLVLALSLGACGGSGEGKETQAESTTAAQSQAETVGETQSAPAETQAETAEAESAQTEATSETNAAADSGAVPTEDRAGNPITVPEEINTIAVLAPNMVEMIVAMGQGDKIIAHDTQSVGLEGLKADLPAFDMMQPDMEMLTSLKPDVLFISNMTLYDDTAALDQLKEMGICVVTVPSSESIAAVKEDIAFVASVIGAQAEGQAIIDAMDAEIERIAAIGETITDKKSVYFEIAAAPAAYSFGSGVFLNEMIEIIGAENILADQQGWLSVELENVVAANPDVILTNVNYIEDPVQEILDRDGWDAVTAVSTQQVYSIDNMASSLANQNIVKAMDEMAKAIYPEYFNE